MEFVAANSIWTAPALTGLAVCVLGWLAAFGVRWRRPDAVSSFDARRRDRLREGNMLYRLMEPAVEWMARRYERGDETKREKLARDLRVAAEKLPWTPAEYVAVRRLEGAMVGVLAVAFGWLLTGYVVAGLLLGVLAAWGCQSLMVRDVTRKAAARLVRLKQRLPYAVDLMALMMEAGATFPEALTAAVKENANHPVGEEFGEVLRETELGRPRREALLTLQQRLRDDDLSELIFAIVKGEEMGTPLAQILRSQADQMRLKRSQHVEREAAEAQVAIVFPGLLIMLACLLIIVAPFLLQVLYGQQGIGALFQ
jgi:tight adherence protein C